MPGVLQEMTQDLGRQLRDMDAVGDPDRQRSDGGARPAQDKKGAARAKT